MNLSSCSLAAALRSSEAAKEQLDKCTLTSRAFHCENLGDFYESLSKLTGKDMVLPMNTGAEAVETALKTARLWGTRVKGVENGKQEIITCENNFHGRTISIISFSTDPWWSIWDSILAHAQSGSALMVHRTIIHSLTFESHHKK